MNEGMDVVVNAGNEGFLGHAGRLTHLCRSWWSSCGGVEHTGEQGNAFGEDPGVGARVAEPEERAGGFRGEPVTPRADQHAGRLCHRRSAGAGASTHRRATTNVPRPGLASTRPSLTSRETARCTVDGPAP